MPRARRLGQRAVASGRASITAGTSSPRRAARARCGRRRRCWSRPPCGRRATTAQFTSIVAHRRGQHHAGHVVAGKGERALDGAGGGDDPPARMRQSRWRGASAPGAWSARAHRPARSRGRDARPHGAGRSVTFGIARSAATARRPSIGGLPVDHRRPPARGRPNARSARTGSRAPRPPAAARAAAIPAIPPPITSTSAKA
jgi:hypothetical protein